ncbi:MAG: hypothetical protein JW982_12820 [Spirochaetes bacterium]|nr:hypothetical protein [Spirochaetota bacterium]
MLPFSCDDYHHGNESEKNKHRLSANRGVSDKDSYPYACYILSDFIYYRNSGTFIDFSFDIIASVITVVSATFFYLFRREIVV